MNFGSEILRVDCIRKFISELSLITLFVWNSGLGCSKLTMSLVNNSLKFQMLISEIC